MAPIQILTNNMLYDFSQVPIPNDAVDEEQVARPRPWNIGEIGGSFSASAPSARSSTTRPSSSCSGSSSAGIHPAPPLFQTGWFVESLMTQTLIIHIIRTNKIPFLQSRASWPLLITTLSHHGLGSVAAVFPTGLFAGPHHLPRMYWPILMLTLLAYMGLTQGVKVWLLRMKWMKASRLCRRALATRMFREFGRRSKSRLGSW
jgi:Mg2+-importing ATPase